MSDTTGTILLVCIAVGIVFLVNEIRISDNEQEVLLKNLEIKIYKDINSKNITEIGDKTDLIESYCKAYDYQFYDSCVQELSNRVFTVRD